ncbi:MAG: hypothetical protein M3O22_08400 [Pseudomonadota bacterium]|nr:hypothetical protein [Pseudomonadota bacterium]
MEGFAKNGTVYLVFADDEREQVLAKARAIDPQALVLPIGGDNAVLVSSSAWLAFFGSAPALSASPRYRPGYLWSDEESDAKKFTPPESVRTRFGFSAQDEMKGFARRGAVYLVFWNPGEDAKRDQVDAQALVLDPDAMVGNMGGIWIVEISSSAWSRFLESVPAAVPVVTAPGPVNR